MWNNERPIYISAIWLSAAWSRMYNRNVFHCNDVNVEPAWTEAHGRHTSEELLKLFDTRENFNGCLGRLFGKCRAHLKCCVEKLWLVNESDWRGAIERRDPLHLPARNVRECDHRFGQRGDRVVEIGPDS